MQKELIYVDTSAFYALIDRSDDNYAKASALWPRLLEDRITLLTSNYVVSETTALLQNRLGFEAARLFHQSIVDILEVHWIDKTIDQLAFELWLSLGRKLRSLVDCASFIIMRQDHVEKTFCFKPWFHEQGFEILPASEGQL